MATFNRFRDPPKSSSSSIDKVGFGVLVYAYGVLLGAAYLLAFWRCFGFNIFSYLSLQDFVTAPLNRIAVLVAAPVLFAFVLFARSDLSLDRTVRTISLYLIFLYCVGFALEHYYAVTRHAQSTFAFENEKTVIVLATILCLASIALAVRIYRSSEGLLLQVFSLILVQTAMSMSAGYSDGKAIFNGAAQVFFLENKELCEKETPREWVYLGRFSEQTIFMNTIDKRLCLTDAKSIKLVSRKFREKL